jgi:hypothetical protein
MSTQPAEAELVAVCGLYCGACPVFRASGDRALAERIAQARDIFPSSESAAAVVGWRRAT